MNRLVIAVFWLAYVLLSPLCAAQELLRDAPRTLITNTRVFDGKADALSAPVNVLVVGNPAERFCTRRS
jgi:hypothetical protein